MDLPHLSQVDVTTPEEHMGDIIGDVNSRRGMVIELAERGNMKVVRAKVPLANMFQYVSSLRSATKGRASYAMQLESYDMVRAAQALASRRSCSPSTALTRVNPLYGRCPPTWRRSCSPSTRATLARRTTSRGRRRDT